jgi:hypothetical protein
MKNHPDSFTSKERGGTVREYKSKATLFGLPLVHMRSGSIPGEPVRPAIGWIAFGDKAYGLLLAGGGLAIGTIAGGGLAIGLVSVGGGSIGALALGGFALGGLALGGAAIGYVAIGGLAIGLLGAMGGLGIAKIFAIGGSAFAAHANDPMAQEFFRKFQWVDFRNPTARNIMTAIGWLPLVAMIFVFRIKTRSQAQRSAK